jgi:hypothetical protein
MQVMRKFAEAYDKGFSEGLRIRKGRSLQKKEHELLNQKTNTTMSKGANNLTKQVELLNSFDNFLSNIQTNLNEVSAKYGKLINELYESGLVKEYADKLNEDNYSSFKAKVGHTNQWISENDKKYTKKVIGQVSDALP